MPRATMVIQEFAVDYDDRVRKRIVVSCQHRTQILDTPLDSTFPPGLGARAIVVCLEEHAKGAPDCRCTTHLWRLYGPVSELATGHAHRVPFPIT